MTDNSPLILHGLDGANPLGFLAALGTLVVLRDSGHPTVRLGWRAAATWVPVLAGIEDEATLCNALAEGLRGQDVPKPAEKRRDEAERAFRKAKKTWNDRNKDIKQRGLRGKELRETREAELGPLAAERDRLRQVWLDALREAVPRPELALGKHLDCTVDELRQHMEGFVTQARNDCRGTVDLVAAFGSDACGNPRDGRMEASPFCFITGSGHQYFLETAGELAWLVTPERLRAALFERWSYRDEKYSMRWDPVEDRRYALMDRDPTATDNKPRTVWMANLLAYRALALFSCAPAGGHLAQTAWQRPDGEPVFNWPLWERPADVDTIRSLLQLRELTEKRLDAPRLRARGIVAAYRARRIRVGSGANVKINFSQARSVL